MILNEHSEPRELVFTLFIDKGQVEWQIQCIYNDTKTLTILTLLFECKLNE